MKLSNNALNFLLAQYRAIFKRAYVKGLASAVILTAGLAAGQAQAQANAYSSIKDINALPDEVVSIDGKNDIFTVRVPEAEAELSKDLEITTGSKSQYIVGSGTATTDKSVVLDGNKHDLKIIGGGEEGDKGFTFGTSENVYPKLQIKDLGTLTIDGATVNLATPNSTKNGDGKQVGIDVGAAKIVIENGAQVNLNNNLVTGDNSNKANAILRGTVMEVTGVDTEVNIGNSDLTGATDAKNSKAVFGWETEYKADGSTLQYDGSEITVSGATLNLQGAVVEQNIKSSNKILGGTKGYAARIQGKTLNMTDATLNVTANGLSGSDGGYGGAGGILAVYKSTLTDSYLTIEDQATLNLEMREYNKDAYYKTLNNGSGVDTTGRDYNGSLTIDGGVVVIDGVLRHTKGGLLEIKDGTQLTGGEADIDPTEGEETKNEHKLNNAIMLGVYGNAANSTANEDATGKLSGSFANSTLATLRLSSNTLDQFLNSTKEDIPDKDESKITDYQGQLLVHHGARIELTDSQQVEMSQFVFNNDAGAGHITTTIAPTSGSSIIGGKDAMIGNPNDNSEVDGTRTIMASNMSIGQSLIADDTIKGVALEQVKSGNSSYAFRFEANDLTLGSEAGTLLEDTKWQGFNSKTSALGAHELKAHRSVTFVDGHSNDFTLQDKVVLDTTLADSDTVLGSGNGDNTGTLKGDNIVIGTSTTAGAISVEGGAWTNTQGQSITLTSGTLSISAQAGEPKDDGVTPNGSNNDTYYSNGVGSSLTLHGGSFKIDGSADDKASITITGKSGATAFLDLRDTAVTWGSGSITVSGADARDSQTDVNSSAGEGILYITGAQFSNFITITGDNASATQLTLGDDGVLAAEGSITGEVDVGTFVTNEAAAGKVYFSGGGTFATNGALTLGIAKEAAADAQKLALGAGTIAADQLTLNNHVEKAKSFVVSGGTLEVAQNLNANVGTVEFKDDGSNGGILVLDRDGESGAGSFNVDLKFDGENSALNVDQGEWNAATKNVYFSNNSTFTVGDKDYNVTGTTADLTLANLNAVAATAGTTSYVYGGSSLTVDTMQAGTNSVFEVTGQLTINGRTGIDDSGSNSKELPEVKKAAKTAGIDLAGAEFNVTGTEAELKLGAVATDKLITFEPSKADSTVSTIELNKALGDAKINLKEFGRLHLDFADGVKLTAANARELKEALEVNGDVANGIINVGSGALVVDWTDDKNLIAEWDAVKDFANIESVTSDELQQALITKVTGQVAGHFGAMQTEQNSATSITVNGVLGLHKARDGYFAFTETNGTKTQIGMQLNANSHLLLEGAGKIGAIAGTTGANSDVTIAQSQIEGEVAGTTEVLGAIRDIDDLNVGNNTTVAGNISANSLSLGAGTTMTNVGTGSAGESFTSEFKSADILTGAEFTTQKLTLQGGTGSTSSWLMGKVGVTETLTVNAQSGLNNEVIVAGGELSAKDTVLAQNVALLVGLDSNSRTDADANDGIDETASYTGSFETQTLDLNGGLLKVDPDFSRDTAFASVARFVDGTADTKLLGTIDGSLYVGRNSVLGLGSQDLAELREIAAQYQQQGKLSGDIQSIAYLDGITSLAQGEGFVMTAKGDTEFTKYMTTDHKWGLTGDGVVADTIYFGDKSALIVTADALNQVGVGTNPNALVTFAATQGKLIADGGEILIDGDLRGNKSYTLFADQGTGTTGNTGSTVDVVDINGDAVTSGNGITVTTENGFLVGEINNDNGGVVTLTLSKDNRAIMSGASDPVYNTLVAYFNGYNGVQDTDLSDGDQTAYIGTPVDTNNDGTIDDYEYSNDFLREVISTGNGGDAETAARLGVYGGAPQAAIQAGKSSTDAIAQRFGIGSAISNLTLAGNTQGAALWLAPVYKSADSDGFEAQGVDYGVNVDLYGVALGADYTLANSITFGAMFNVGSGEVDGEGAASSTSNDFDYYGFGLYAGYTMGQFSVVGDVSYTSVDNDLEGNTSVGNIKSSMDSTNLSIGVTGKYELSFNGVDITPHAGLRFSNIDLDDYTIDGNDVIASADSDDMSIFSIPVGVTVAKEFKGETWTVAPSFDLTLTGQFGDDELDGSVSWAGVSNLSTHTTTEVFDNFTYGATLGVEAQSVGGVALGLSVGYTGSSNTDELGVNANARFVF